MAGINTSRHVWILGDNALALAGRKIVKNHPAGGHDVSGYLSTGTPEGWRIADLERDAVGDIGETFSTSGP